MWHLLTRVPKNRHFRVAFTAGAPFTATARHAFRRVSKHINARALRRASGTWDRPSRTSAAAGRWWRRRRCCAPVLPCAVLPPAPSQHPARSLRAGRFGCRAGGGRPRRGERSGAWRACARSPHAALPPPRCHLQQYSKQVSMEASVQGTARHVRLSPARATAPQTAAPPSGYPRGPRRRNLRRQHIQCESGTGRRRKPARARDLSVRDCDARCTVGAWQ